MSANLSAIVLTYNEERHIRDCLESLRWCDEICILDSGSTDQTLEICREYTGRIVFHAFENFSAQRNWALDNLPLRNEWVLFVDADERITPEVQAEIQELLHCVDPEACGFFIPRKQYFWGKWLRYGECWPSYQMKLFKRSQGRFLNHEVHESVQINGKSGFLHQPMIHLSRESMAEVLDKMNWFTTLDAIRMYRTGQPLYASESPSYSVRNQHLKRIFAVLPCKPVTVFLWQYIVRQGFRDGYLGFAWAVTQALYVFLANFKAWEFRQGIVPVPLEAYDDGGREA